MHIKNIVNLLKCDIIKTFHERKGRSYTYSLSGRPNGRILTQYYGERRTNDFEITAFGTSKDTWVPGDNE